MSKFADFLKQPISVVGTVYTINLTSGKDTTPQALSVAQRSRETRWNFSLQAADNLNRLLSEAPLVNKIV